MLRRNLLKSLLGVCSLPFLPGKSEASSITTPASYWLHKHGVHPIALLHWHSIQKYCHLDKDGRITDNVEGEIWLLEDQLEEINKPNLETWLRATWGREYVVTTWQSKVYPNRQGLRLFTFKAIV